MKNKTYKTVLLVVIAILMLTGCDNFINSKESSMGTTTTTPAINTKGSKSEELEFLKRLLKIIQNNDVSSFKEIMPTDGSIVLVRSFCSGNGTRGKDVKIDVKVEEVGRDLEFPVQGETPIEFGFLLQVANDKGVDNISTELVDDRIDFEKILIYTDVWEKCTDILGKLSDKEWNPRLIILNDNQYAFYEGGDVSGFPLGGWFVFEKRNNEFNLQGVFDLR